MLWNLKSFSIRLFLVISIVTVFFALHANRAHAFNNISDTVTTSRPSASSPLNAHAVSGDTQLTIYGNNSRFLASDSAKIIRAGAQITGGLKIASQSADLTTVYLGSPNTVGAAAQMGTDVLLLPATAMHTVQFTTSFQLGTTDSWKLTFPALTIGDANTTASASATTFQLNGVVSGTGGRDNIKIYDVTASSDITNNFTITATNPSGGTSPLLNFANSTSAVTAGHQIRIFIGCSAITGSGSSVACSTQVPRIINPTKTNVIAGQTATADSWKIVLSQAGTATDTTTVSVATIESVTVRATVDPTLVFKIIGINTGSAINTGNSSGGCSLATLTTSGVNSAANEVNLGVVQNTPGDTNALTNTAAQRIEISTNGSNGYSLTATSSSSLYNPTSGFFFRSSTTPIDFPNSVATPAHFFGLHPCGVDVNTTWINGGAAGSSTCNVVAGTAASNCQWAWPTAGITTNTTPLTIASAAVGPIGSGNGTAGSGIVSVAYAAGTDVTVPPGQYRAIITYTATPTF
jgi:hypothetical protein